MGEETKPPDDAHGWNEDSTKRIKVRKEETAKPDDEPKEEPPDDYHEQTRNGIRSSINPSTNPLSEYKDARGTIHKTTLVNLRKPRPDPLASFGDSEKQETLKGETEGIINKDKELRGTPNCTGRLPHQFVCVYSALVIVIHSPYLCYFEKYSTQLCLVLYYPIKHSIIMRCTPKLLILIFF